MLIYHGFIMQILLFFLLVIPQLLMADFHLFTVATKPHPALDQLLHSCEKQGLKITVLGMGLPYPSNGMKFIWMQEAVRDLPADDIVLFVDGYDTLLLADEKTLLERFAAFEAPLVMGAETNCAPYKNLFRKFPKSPTPFRYINTGTYMGYVSQIRKVFDEISPIQPNLDDQGVLSMYYVNHQDKMVLDTNCDLFLTLHRIDPEQIVIDREKCQVIAPTKTIPCVVHGNGDGKYLYQDIYDKLFRSE